MRIRLIAVCALICFSSACATTKLPRKLTLPEVDSTQATVFEREMGEAVYVESRRLFGYEIDIHYKKRLNTVLRKLIPYVHRPNITYYVHVLDTNIKNAYIAPDGGIYFTRGMMEFLDDDDLIAAVLAHELSHVSHKHVLRKFERYAKDADNRNAKKVGIQFFVVLLTLGLFKLTPTGLDMIIDKHYSMHDEIEADLLGCYYLKKAGYPPTNMLALLDRYNDLPGYKPIYFKTHPSSHKRYKRVEAFIEEGIPT